MYGANAGSRCHHCCKDGSANNNGKDQEDIDDNQDGGNDQETSLDFPGSLQGKDEDHCWFGVWLVVASVGLVIWLACFDFWVVADATGDNFSRM
jgi:hypothetical protein